MDWEKQDNELRQLMEGHAFLPDQETWNATAAWKKLRQKQNKVAKRPVPVWIRLSVAACLAGLLGLAGWYLLSRQFSPGPVEAVAGKGNADKKQRVDQSVLGEIAQPSVKPDKGKNMQQSIGPEATGGSMVKVKSQGKEQEAHNRIQNREGLHKTMATIPADTFVTSRAVAAVIPNTAVIVPTPADNTAENNPATSGAMVAAPDKKPKTRVVHFNQLGSAQPAVVPVYAQTKKLFFEPGSLLVQSSQNPAEQSFQLKIDISPAPKKSL